MSRDVYGWINSVSTRTMNDGSEIALEVLRLLCDAVNHYADFRRVGPASFQSNDTRYVPPKRAPLPPPESLEWRGLQLFFDLEWFWRLWVIQEIALSSTAVIVWGHFEIAWSYVGLAAAYLRTNHYEVLARHPMPGVYNAYIMYRISNNDDVAPPLSLRFLRLLTYTRQFGASDDRDRIYALLGLPSANHDPGKELFMEPDYTLSIRTVYRETARKIIAQEGNLSVLSSVQHSENYDSTSEEESWVPMWNKVFTHTLTCSDQECCHDASGGISMASATLTRPNSSYLYLNGIRVDKVTSWFPLMAQSQFNIQPETYSSHKEHFLHELMYACSDHSLLCSTLSAGKDWHGLHVQAEERHLNDYVSWLQTMLSSFAQVGLHFRIHFNYHTHTLPASLRRRAMEGNETRFAEAARIACVGRKLFFTRSGRLGLGPAAIREGDNFCILFGADMPFILRPCGFGFRFIGECYVKTLMHGEGVEAFKKKEQGAVVFSIR